VADDRRLLVEAADDGLEMVSDLADGLAGEHLGMGRGLLDRLGVVGPARGQGHIAIVVEDLRPAVPAAGQQPQAMDEHHRLAAGLVGALAMLELVLGDRLGVRGGAGLGAGQDGLLPSGVWDARPTSPKTSSQLSSP
jgi:hypothetical protein